jgi:hypothetical protein
MARVKMLDGVEVTFPVTLHDRYNMAFILEGFEQTLYGPRVYSQVGRTRLYHELDSFGLVLDEREG